MKIPILRHLFVETEMPVKNHVKTWKYLAAAAGVLFCTHVAQAQTLVDRWSYTGGGLDPATYAGDYQPSTLVPDTAFSNGATIGLSGVTFGGLGSGGFGDYGGIYTFFSASYDFTMETTTILSGLDEVTITFLVGGGSPSPVDYDASSLMLNYNGSNPSVASGFFEQGAVITVPSPIGDQDLTPYTWMWSNLSALGTTTGFSTSWDTQGNAHVFVGEVSLTQAVPEPSTSLLLVLGMGSFLFRRRRSSTCRA